MKQKIVDTLEQLHAQRAAVYLAPCDRPAPEQAAWLEAWQPMTKATVDDAEDVQPRQDSNDPSHWQLMTHGMTVDALPSGKVTCATWRRYGDAATPIKSKATITLPAKHEYIFAAWWRHAMPNLMDYYDAWFTYWCYVLQRGNDPLDKVPRYTSVDDYAEQQARHCIGAMRILKRNILNKVV